MPFRQPVSYAFDMGTNSIGWCVFRLNAAGHPVAIADAGVRIYSDGRDPQSKTSLAVARREAKAAARRRDRTKRRQKATLRTLAEYGLMPGGRDERERLLRETADSADRNAPANDPLNLRARALTEKLPLHHIGRALFHLGQRRGFKSNRKTDRRDNDKGKIAIGIDRLRDAIREAKAETLGVFLASRRAQGLHVRLRAGSSVILDDGYDFYPVRSLLEEEFRHIWDAQAVHYPDVLTEARGEHLFKVIFYQRPLKKPRIGSCTFNPLEQRLAKAHPLFQAFRLYKEVNELEIVAPDLSQRKLTLDERDALVRRLRGAKTAKYKTLRKDLKLTPDMRFNKESENRVDMAGDEVTAALSAKGLFGPRWNTLAMDSQWKVIERIQEEENPFVLHQWLVETHGLSDDAAEAVAACHLPEGYGRLGHTALSIMLEELKADVIPEAKAAERAGYNHSYFGTGEIFDELPKYQEVVARSIPPGTGDLGDEYDVRKGRITNPTVHIGLNQLQRLVNGLIRRFGKPAEIAVELARDLKTNEKKKTEINRRIGENTRAARQRSEKIAELRKDIPALVDNGYNRLLLKLWEELNPAKPEDRCCIYTGKPISISMLFSGAVDVDHILPYSRTLDDGQGNKLLCLREANRVKRNRAPSEVTEWANHYEEILERANRLPKPKRWRFARDAMADFDADSGFLDRQLTDTQYLSRLAREYLCSLYPEKHEQWRVRVIPGRMTEMLRRNWGLNKLLPDHIYSDAKNRNDHRHHAIDAAVVGVTTRSMLQRISTEAARREEQELEDVVKGIPVPWEHFRDDLQQALDNIVVSHKPDHGTVGLDDKGKWQTAGKLHNDTAYGLTGEADARGNTIVVRRKMLLSLTDKDIPAIRDDELRARLYSAVGGLSGKELQQALLDFARKDPKYRGIRRVRVTEPLTVIPIRDKDGNVYKGYKGDANYRYDVWEMKDGKWQAEVISMFDAHQKGWESPVRKANPTARKVLSLQQNDMVAYEHPSDGYTIARVVKFASSGQIVFARNNEGGSLKARDSNRDDPFKYFSKTANGLREIKARQIRIDETGRVYDPGPRDRESRLISNQKLKTIAI